MQDFRSNSRRFKNFSIIWRITTSLWRNRSSSTKHWRWRCRIWMSGTKVEILCQQLQLNPSILPCTVWGSIWNRPSKGDSQQIGFLGTFTFSGFERIFILENIFVTIKNKTGHQKPKFLKFLDFSSNLELLLAIFVDISRKYNLFLIC